MLIWIGWFVACAQQHPAPARPGASIGSCEGIELLGRLNTSVAPEKVLRIDGCRRTRTGVELDLAIADIGSVTLVRPATGWPNQLVITARSWRLENFGSSHGTPVVKQVPCHGGACQVATLTLVDPGAEDVTLSFIDAYRR